eukprot:GEMP01089341.1.p1 GENE.GEMP01089341.1~~GEMP01089341.1.p1  ORF type:complete len:256 (+),score=54.91 GEMP01089341.1:14-781(+)
MIEGYKVLRVPFHEGSPFSRALLVKQNVAKTKEERKKDNCTLFVTHIDRCVTEAALQKCFGNFGPLDQAVLTRVTGKKKGASEVCFAHLRFENSEDMQRVLKCATGFAPATLPLAKDGLKETTKRLKDRYPDPAELQMKVDSFIVEFEAREAAKKKVNAETTVDEDGFTMVKSGVTHAPDGTRVLSVRKPEKSSWSLPENSKKKKKTKEVGDFYKFQVKEKARQDIEQHRKRNVEDEEQITRMRKKRKFAVPEDA